MADARAVAEAQARRYFKSKRDRRIFLRQMDSEAHFQDQTSPAGAEGPAQIMPATARAWGVRNVHDPEQAYAAAASHMRQYLDSYGGSWSKALTAYNAGPGAVGRPLPGETRNYISKILGGSDVAASGGGSSSSAAAALPGLTTQRVELGTKNTFDQAGFDQARKRFALAGLLSKHGTDSPLFKTGLLSLTAPSQMDFQHSEMTSKTITNRAVASSSSPSRGGPRGRIALAPGANRPGVGVQQVLKSFVSEVAGRARRPVTITTGTNHNRLTVDGNVSDHYDGHGADIAQPVDSQQGDLLAAHALQTAGVPWKKALSMAQQGGLFTLNPTSGRWKGKRVQVIWRTNQGGNHHNHVHIGVR